MSDSLTVAILGAGGVGLSYAAWLASRGHRIRLWTPSGRSVAPFRPAGNLSASGLLSGMWRVAAANSLPDAVSEADVVILAIPSNAHRPVLSELVPLLAEKQVVVLSAPIGFSSIFLRSRLQKAGKRNVVAVWPVPALNGRLQGPGEVYVSGARPALDVAAWPIDSAAIATELCRVLFGIDVIFIGDLLVAELSNINAVAHAGNALCNLTRMEKGEIWFTYAGVTPRVARLIEAADRERIEIGAALGLKLKPFAAYLREWYGLQETNLASLTAKIAARPNPTPGPRTDCSRYVTEDIPYGIMGLAKLGQTLGTATVMLDALATIFDVLYEGTLSRETGIEAEIAEIVHPASP